MTANELLQQIGEVRANFEEAMTRSDAEIKKFGEANTETQRAIDEMATKMAGLEATLQEIRAAQQRPAANAMVSGNGDGEVNPEERKAMVDYLRTGSLEGYQKRGLTPAIDGDGGYLVPKDFKNDIVSVAYDYGAIRQYANVMTTTSDMVGENSIGPVTVAWGPVDFADQTPDINAYNFPVNPCKGMVKIKKDLLADSGTNIDGTLVNAFGRAFAQSEDQKFCQGTGVGQPQGMFTHPDVLARFSKTGIAAALSDSTHNGADALTDVMMGVKADYRQNGVWVMNSQTLAAVMKFKNTGDGALIWVNSTREGAPSTIWGRPVAIAEGAPDIAANAFPILFADLKAGYHIFDREGITVQRLNELYATSDQMAILVKRRLAAGVMLSEAFNCLKVST